MPNLYRTESSHTKTNAQRNLCGRTHYVDDDTLRHHKSRILSARVVDNGLLFAIVESVAADYEGKTRGFRYVIFDIFGHAIGKRNALDSLYGSSGSATKAMWNELNAIDAPAVTLAAIERETQQHEREMDQLREQLITITPCVKTQN